MHATSSILSQSESYSFSSLKTPGTVPVKAPNVQITQSNLDESPTKPAMFNRVTTNLGRELSIIESESIGETDYGNKPSFVDRVNTAQMYNLD